MWVVNLCAGLAVIQSALTDNGASLMIAIAALSGAILMEFLLNRKLRRSPVFDGSASASALVFSLLLPNTFPPLLAFLASVFAITVIKYSFGGLGANWVNPAVGAWLFARVSWPAAFEEALKDSPLTVLSALSRGGEILPHDSPLSLLAMNGVNFVPDVSSLSGLDAIIAAGAESTVTFLNRTIFSLLNARLPIEYASLFAPRFPAIIADRGLFCLLAGTIIITAFQASRIWLPVLFLLVYAFLVRVFGAALHGGAPGDGDILFGICSGGIIAAVFLLNADPVTAPKSRGGKAAAAVLAAILTFLFRYMSFEPYGAFFAAALINVLVLLFRRIETRLFYQREALYDE
jgi:electron transport complex protein RnfD